MVLLLSNQFHYLLQLCKLTTKITYFWIFFRRVNKYRTNLQVLYLRVQLLQQANINKCHLQVLYYFSELFCFDFCQIHNLSGICLSVTCCNPNDRAIQTQLSRLSQMFSFLQRKCSFNALFTVREYLQLPNPCTMALHLGRNSQVTDISQVILKLRAVLAFSQCPRYKLGRK